MLTSDNALHHHECDLLTDRHITDRTWEVPRSKVWASVAPAPSFKPEEGSKASPFAYTSKYKHLLNMRNTLDEEDEEDMQKFSSMVEKEWKAFMQSGFAPPDNAKLRFDLTGAYGNCPCSCDCLARD